MKAFKVAIFTLCFLLAGCAAARPPSSDLSQMAHQIGGYLGVRPDCTCLPQIRLLPDGLYVPYENTIFLKDPNNQSLMAHELAHWLLRGKYPPEIQEVMAQEVADWWRRQNGSK